MMRKNGATMSIFNRLEKLEAAESSCEHVIVLFQEDGESSDECIRRSGRNPDEMGIKFIVVCFVSATV